MLSTLLKNIGFGFAATGFQDQMLENAEGNNAIYNLCALTIGTLMWASGCYLETRNYDRTSYHPHISRSTAIIQQGLSHACGMAVVTSATHFIKNVDTISGKMAMLNAGIFGPAAIMELTKASFLPTTIPWEKSRLLVLIISDYAAAAGVKNFMNNDDKSPLTIAAICIGLFLSGAEFAYGVFKDRGLDLRSYINRRFFKIIAGVNLIFTLLDIIKLDNYKYTIADDVFCTLCSLLLFATLLELRAASNATKARHEILLARYSGGQSLFTLPTPSSASVELLVDDEKRSDKPEAEVEKNTLSP